MTDNDCKIQKDLLLSNLLTAGLIAIAMGSIVGALLFQFFMFFSGGDWEPFLAATLFIPTAIAMALSGLVTLTILSILVVVPMRYYWKLTISRKWMTVVCAAAGAVINSLPWAVMSYNRYFSGRVVYTPEDSQGGVSEIAVMWGVMGLVFGSLLGYWFTYFNQRNRQSAHPDHFKNDVEGASEPPRAETRLPVMLLGGLLLLLAFLLVWMFTIPVRMVASANRAAVTHQRAILVEAQQMLDETVGSKMRSLTFGSSDERRCRNTLKNWETFLP